jgi:hypothetical protein
MGGVCQHGGEGMAPQAVAPGTQHREEGVSVQAANQPATLPGGAPLAPGEVSLMGDRFMFSTIAFYLHTELVLTNRRLYAVRPNTIFGLIPVGTGRSTFPVENIAGVSAGTRFDVIGVMIGAFAVLFGAAAAAIPGLHLALLGALLLILGVGAIAGTPKQAIEVMNSGGGVIRFPVSVFERGRTIEFANRMSEAVARTSPRAPATAASVDPIASDGDPSRALRHLEGLRDQGLITEPEYAAKRAEILARL